jgi:hypothetical protein
MLTISISGLKWLVISHRSYPCNVHPPAIIDEKKSTFITDAVFVKILSLMQLEHLAFEVDPAKVTTIRSLQYDIRILLLLL